MLLQKQDGGKTDNLFQPETEGICCPLLEPQKWNDVQHIWNKKPSWWKPFPRSFTYPFQERMRKQSRGCGSELKMRALRRSRMTFCCWPNDPTAFESELYMSLTAEVPGGRNEKFTGTFHSRVFEGRYGDIIKFVNQTEQSLDANKMIAKKHYIYFPNCPK